MNDMKVQAEKLRTDAAECELIRDLAISQNKRELFNRLAEHLNALACEIERAMAIDLAGNGEIRDGHPMASGCSAATSRNAERAQGHRDSEMSVRVSRLLASESSRRSPGFDVLTGCLCTELLSIFLVEATAVQRKLSFSTIRQPALLMGAQSDVATKAPAVLDPVSTGRKNCRRV